MAIEGGRRAFRNRARKLENTADTALGKSERFLAGGRNARFRGVGANSTQREVRKGASRDREHKLQHERNRARRGPQRETREGPRSEEERNDERRQSAANGEHPIPMDG